jgi:hypothetical protein
MSRCHFPVAFLTQAQVPFLHAVDFKGIRRGWDLTVEPAGGAEGCRQEDEDDNDEGGLPRILVRELLYCWILNRTGL